MSFTIIWRLSSYVVNFIFKSSPLRLLNQTNPNLAEMVLGFVQQPYASFMMAAVTKNRHFFNCPWLLYYKSNQAQIVAAATMH